jgi:hypothetical protein
MKIEFRRQIFEISSGIKFNENLSCGSGVVLFGRANRHDEANTGCGRKNSPISEGNSFGWERVQWWGARCRTAVYVPFSVYTMAWSGEHPAFIVEEFIKNGGSQVQVVRNVVTHGCARELQLRGNRRMEGVTQLLKRYYQQ